MKVSEKSLELNIGAELLGIMRTQWGMPKAYLRGLTQREEKQEGVDFFVQLDPATRIFAFQFKAPRGKHDVVPYRYTISRPQHDPLHKLAKDWPSSVHYVFPFYVTSTKLQQHVPNLSQETWLLDIATMKTEDVFGKHQTRTIQCNPGLATVNPEYTLEALDRIRRIESIGVPASSFAEWYASLSEQRRDESGRRNPWIVRGFRLAVVTQSEQIQTPA